MIYFTVIVAFVMLLVSCGQPVDLNYDKLEAQYIELTPYWNIVIEQKELVKDQNAAIGFSKYYKEARYIINYYNTSGRDIGPAGKSKDAPNDQELLWNLRNALNSASARTNAIVSD